MCRKHGRKISAVKGLLNYTEYFAEAMVFNDIIAVHRYIEKHGPLKLATIIKA